MTESNKIRNVVLAGHSSSGKTSLAESMLYISGSISRPSKVEEGHTASDFDPNEIKRKISISTSVLPINWQGFKINILDTPGFADFFGEVESAMSVAETALIIVDAIAGIRVQTNRVANRALEKELTSLFFINRLDKEHAKFNEIVEEIQGLTSKTTAVAFLPIGLESNFKGIVDLITLKAYEFSDKEVKEIEIPQDMQAEVDDKREKLVEAAAENDDILLEKYLDSGSLEPDEFIQGLKSGIKNGNISLVFCGSALKNTGIATLLDYINKLCPSPLERSSLMALKGDEETEIKPSADAPFSALIFKTVADPYVGKLSYVKVFTGSLKKDQPVIDVNSNHKQKIAHIYEVKGKEQKEVGELAAGDIGAVPKLDGATTADTLSADSSIKYDVIKLPESVLSFAIDPKSKGDEEKLGTSLTKLTAEDPTLKIRKDTQTKESVISGLGDMHLEVVLDKLKQRFGVEAIMHAPKIPYREAIKGTAKAQGKYKKQTGGRGQYGDVWLRLEPSERGKYYEFLNEIKGGVVPSSYFPAVAKGIAETMENGVIAGYPVVDVKVALYDGSFHPVDSSEMAFKIAASMAFKQAFKEAGPVLLEPIMHIEAHLPEKYVGDVISNLSSKRGRVQGTEASGKYHTVKAEVPLEEVSKYAIELRSITHGEGDFTMSFSHYEEMPPDAARKIIAKYEESKEH